MRISARVTSSASDHVVTVETEGSHQSLAVPGKPAGGGSAVNGGELLFAALATCYCNDVYREAVKFGVTIDRVDVRVVGQFGGVGDPAREVSYDVNVVAHGDTSRVEELLRHVDSIAEVHNTLRINTEVKLNGVTVAPSS